MTHYYLYRKNGGQVLGCSVDPAAYLNANTDYLGVLINPPTPNGPELVPTKIHDDGAVRNATPAEIANFEVAEAQDANLQQREQAGALFEDSPMWRKFFKNFLELLIEEFNTLRGLHSLAPRTLQQAIDVIKGKIDTGTND